MIHMPFRLSRAAVAAVVLVTAVPAQAQQTGERDSNFFGQLFGGSERFGGNDRSDGGRGEAPMAPGQMVQASPPDLVVRLDRLENQIRQLTGLVEQLQFRNQQLEQQLRAMQGVGGMSGAGAVPPGAPPPPRPQSAQPAQPPAPLGPPQRRSDVYEPQSDSSAAVTLGNNPAITPPAGPRPPQRRADVFDPNENPSAPGSPRTLGSIPSGPGSIPSGPGSIPSSPNVIRGEPGDDADGGPPLGAPGGRQAGAPLDLSTLSGRAANDPSLATPVPVLPGGALPAPPPRNPNATGPYQQQAMAPATTTSKEEYDNAYGHLVRKDYAVAEDGFRGFLRKNPSDRMAGEANYWLGETLFQRQRYREAAESFLTVSTKFEKSAKAPDALVRLGQSLAALKEKEAACATFSEIGRKFPRASPSVKQSVEREQKRAGC
jgi:tol-pal system protein YbgF